MELRRVDLNLLVVLDVLLTECNVTKAARRLNMSQPATSTALARLRKQFDDPLLVKSGRTLRPTPRALALAEPLRRVLSTVERSILTVPEFDPATAERAFILLTGDYSEVTLLRNLLRRNRYRSHGIRFDMQPLSVAGIEAFHRHEVDLAVVPEQLLATSEFEQCRRRVVLHDRYVGVVWSGHPYAGIELTPDVLAGYPLLSYLQYGGDKSLGRTLSRAGIATRTSATTTNIAVLPYVLDDRPRDDHPGAYGAADRRCGAATDPRTELLASRRARVGGMARRVRRRPRPPLAAQRTVGDRHTGSGSRTSRHTSLRGDLRSYPGHRARDGDQCGVVISSTAYGGSLRG